MTGGQAEAFAPEALDCWQCESFCNYTKVVQIFISLCAAQADKLSPR
jgi:hypothetical protein